MSDNRPLKPPHELEIRPMKKRVSRSKNGCLRCKERRLKCDETRPACNQCQLRKHPCPGYQTLMRWSSKYEVFAANQQSENQSSTSGVAKQPQKTGQPHGVGQANTRQYQLPIQEPSAAGSEISVVGDLVTDDPMVDLSLPPHTFSPVHDNGSISDPSSNSYLSSDLVRRILSPSDGYGIVGDDLTSFTPTDQDFWSSLTLDWSSIPFGSTDPLAPTPLPPANRPAAGDVSSVLPAGEDLPTFNPSDVTDEDTSTLLKHYFDNILSINSVYDNRDNPLRYLVSRYIKSSPLVRTCVLSASELHLMSNDRNMHQRVVRYHSDALKCIATAIEQLETTAPLAEQNSVNQTGTFLAGYVDRLQQALLALLLVGVSSSWLDPSDIGVNHLVRARRLFTTWMDAVKTLSRGTTRSVEDERNTSFIIGAMAYWEMVTAFVANQAINVLDYLEPFCQQKGKEKIYPNPWTGVNTPICIVMAQVGVYIRQKLVISKLQSLGWPRSIYGTMLDELLRRAAKLETFALGYEPPTRSQVESSLESPLDAFSELESMAHTYRLTAVLELYRCFPQLGYTDDIATSGSTENPTFDPSMHSLSSSVLHEEFGGQLSSNHETIVYELALSLLGLLKQTEERRATSLAHTLALLIGGSALRHWPTSQTSNATDSTRHRSIPARAKVTDLLVSLNSRAQVVEGWRSFVRERLKSNADFVGLESFRRTQALMEKIWLRLDSTTEHSLPPAHGGPVSIQGINGLHLADQTSAHWLDVMAECRLETLFG